MLKIFRKIIEQNLKSFEKSNHEVIDELDNINERFNSVDSTLEEIYEFIQNFSLENDANFAEYMNEVNGKLDYIIEMLEEKRQNDEIWYN